MQESEFGKHFTAWMEDHKFVSVNKNQLLECIALAERGARAIEILRRLYDGFDPQNICDDQDDVSLRYSPGIGVMKKEIREVLK